MVDPYEGVAPADLPLYPFLAVACYLRLPLNTIVAWTRGTTYTRGGKTWRFRPIIRPADRSYLSLRNVFELLVLKAITREESIPLKRVRVAVEQLRKEFGTEHPLSDVPLLSDRTDILVEKAGELLNVSRAGQWEIAEEIAAIVRRVDVASDGHVVFRPYDDGLMDPAVQFGRLCIAGTRVPTEEVFLRFKAGESIREISADLDCLPQRIERAVQFEESIRQAA